MSNVKLFEKKEKANHTVTCGKGFYNFKIQKQEPLFGDIVNILLLYHVHIFISIYLLFYLSYHHSHPTIKVVR